MDLNRATIIGRLTRDPELRSLPSGRSVASFSVATNRQWTDANGQRQKQVEYHNVVVWARLAETAGQYLRKGSRLYVEGRLQTREWTGQDGAKRTRTEIVGDNFIMLDGRAVEGSFAGPGSATAAPAYQPAGASSAFAGAPPADKPTEVIEEEIKVEDIPF